MVRFTEDDGGVTVSAEIIIKMWIKVLAGILCSLAYKINLKITRNIEASGKYLPPREPGGQTIILRIHTIC